MNCIRCGKLLVGLQKRFCSDVCKSTFYQKEKLDFLNNMTPKQFFQHCYKNRTVKESKRQYKVIKDKSRFVLAKELISNKLQTGNYQIGKYIITVGIKGRSGSDRVKKCLDKGDRRRRYNDKRIEIYNKRKAVGICIKCGFKTDDKYIQCSKCRQRTKELKLLKNQKVQPKAVQQEV